MRLSYHEFRTLRYVIKCERAVNVRNIAPNTSDKIARIYSTYYDSAIKWLRSIEIIQDNASIVSVLVQLEPMNRKRIGGNNS
jgi:hypothetical protein